MKSAWAWTLVVAVYHFWQIGGVWGVDGKHARLHQARKVKVVEEGMLCHVGGGAQQQQQQLLGVLNGDGVELGVCEPEGGGVGVGQADAPDSNNDKVPKVSIAIATTVLHPDVALTQWLDYHLNSNRIQHVIIYMDDPTEHSLFRSLIGSQYPVTLFPGAQTSPQMTPESRLILRQMANIQHAITHLQTQGTVDWLLHIDIDELLYEPNSSESVFNCGEEVGHIHFTNHEALPLPPSTTLSRKEEAYFASTHFRLNTPPNANFMAYGNGKSAVRLRPSSSSSSKPKISPLGPHSFEGFTGTTFNPDPIRQAMILHYPHPTFELWVKKFKHYGMFSGYWYDDRRYPIRVEFMLRSRDLVVEGVRSGDWRGAREFWEGLGGDLGEEEGGVGVFRPFGRREGGR